MLQRRPDRPFFLRRASGNLGIFRFRQIVILSNIQPTFPFDFGDIQAGHLQPELLQHIRLDFLLGGLALGGGQVHLNMVFHFEFGQKTYRLHMGCLSKPLNFQRWT